MLKTATVTTFTFSELLRENQQEGGRVKLPLSSFRLGLTMRIWFRHLRDIYHYLFELERNNAPYFHALRKVREETN